MHPFSIFHGASHRLLAPLVGALAASALLLAPGLAHADSSSTLTIDGTSDVSDSGLIQNVIQPAFQAAFPQYKFTYNGSATGTAIGNVEAGTGGPSMLIVHAASLENQFVQQGFSFNNQPGNALFDNDFVVVGTRPTVAGGDPAAVLANDPNNAAQGFADIATQGAAGNDFFVSRGGTTTASGTTVQEHAIWAVVQQSNLAPGVSFCTVSTADGGGASPIVAGHANPDGSCPDSGTVTGADAPPWYLINTGANQAANILATNACTVGGAAHTANTCYSITDRATYDFLTTQANPNPVGGVVGTVNQIPNLGILTRDNAATAPGGANLLINYFHAYIVNPDKPNETPNIAAAQAFISVVTSPSVQASISHYLSVLNANAGDTGSPFKPTASPSITAGGIPATATAGQTVTVSGQVTNLQPGFAAFANQPITVDEIEGGLPVPVKAGTTTATGSYSIAFTPPSSGTYEVSTGATTLLENAALGYSDILSAGTSTPTSLTLTATSTLDKVTASSGSVSAAGTLLPVAPDANAQATLLARPTSSNGTFKVIGSEILTQGQAVYAITGALKGGQYTVEVQYSDPGQLATATTAPQSITVPANSVTVKFAKVKNKNGNVTVSGKLSGAPAITSGTVKLFALDVGTVKTTKVTKKKPVKKPVKKKSGQKTQKSTRIVAAAKSATFTQAGKVTVKAGKATFTIKHTFARGHRYAFQLRYTHKGQTTIPSGFKFLDVH